MPAEIALPTEFPEVPPSNFQYSLIGRVGHMATLRPIIGRQQRRGCGCLPHLSPAWRPRGPGA